VQIVSNIDDEQFLPMLERLDLFRVIDAWTSSDQAGSCKPDPAIYRLAVAKAGVAPEDALFVGDSIGHDVEGPTVLGIRTAWLAPRDGADPGSARPDSVITALADVLDLAGVGVVR
jgi:putative hydrolase of the HAD superfamily